MGFSVAQSGHRAALSLPSGHLEMFSRAHLAALPNDVCLHHLLRHRHAPRGPMHLRPNMRSYHLWRFEGSDCLLVKGLRFPLSGTPKANASALEAALMVQMIPCVLVRRQHHHCQAAQPCDDFLRHLHQHISVPQDPRHQPTNTQRCLCAAAPTHLPHNWTLLDLVACYPAALCLCRYCSCCPAVLPSGVAPCPQRRQHTHGRQDPRHWIPSTSCCPRVQLQGEM
mmetsp:Transcript_43826/g.101249  ORF Transcript_43826/g.101249 Transcript_43826/m.101249 type:complete len:225 (+) Transcript_43826:263-937(+)